MTDKSDYRITTAAGAGATDTLSMQTAGAKTKYAVDTSLFDALVDQASGAADSKQPAKTSTRALKQRLLQPDDDDIVFLSDMLDRRLTEGQGEAVVEIGYDVTGADMDLKNDEVGTVTETLTNAAQVPEVNAFVQLLFDSAAPAEDAQEVTYARQLGDAAKTKSRAKNSGAATQTRVLQYLVRRRPANVEEMLELRVAVAGNVDAGKSTMLGVLTRGRLDDGRGKMRVALFRHKHEIESGRTSSVGMEILGFDKINGAPVRHTDARRKVGWDQVCSRSSKMVTFLDLAGHEKYLKTTVFGIAGSAPDYLMLMIAANAGLAGMAKEHLGLALALNIPVFVVITKIDMCPPNVLDTTLKQLTRVLRSSGCRKLPIAVSDRKSVVMAASRFVSQRVCPIFQVSNVTGEGVDSLQTFINILPMSRPVVAATGNVAPADSALPVSEMSSPTSVGDSTTDGEADETLRYDINEIFTVPFVGTVVSGVVSSGRVRLGDTVWLGPDFNGKFTTTTVRGIQRKRADVQTGHRGQSVSLALKKITRAQVRKGMVILGKDEQNTMPHASRTFEAEVVVLYHSTTITMRYQAMVHCGAVRQTARVLSIVPTDSKEDVGQNDTLRTGDRAKVIFQFVRHPEHIAVGSRLIFREGRTKGVGKVLRVLNPAEESQAVHAATKGTMVFNPRTEKMKAEALRHRNASLRGNA
ncbi:hypothetical protein H4R20_003655 [Coemansia guatemalensis]|uniref:Tr-type G domain-containing protein n=1 Tax=Coemansia guatemalensis TaxID=2761395 RepID=A0A9W8I046_9FUNG|nr:hypothetical protein H4R20_003655 [Coemansia guatemalensis]